MAQCTIQMVVGGLPADTLGQWIDGLFIINRPDRFIFSADLCRMLPTGEFSLYRVGVQVPESFTAELGLALMLNVAEPPFTPSTGGLEVRIDGDSRVADGEVARLVDPVVRQFAHVGLVPLKVARDLAEQRERCTKYHSLHQQLDTLNNTD